MNLKFAPYFISALFLGISIYASALLFFKDSRLPRLSPQEASLLKESSNSTSSRFVISSERLSSSVWNSRRWRSLDASKALSLKHEAISLENLIDQGEDERFLAEIKRLNTLFPHEPLFMALHSEYLMNNARWEEAESKLREFVTADPENQEAQVSLAEVLTIERNFPESLALNRQVLKTNPGHFRALHGILVTHEMMGSRELGVQELKDLLELHPSQPMITKVLLEETKLQR